MFVITFLFGFGYSACFDGIEENKIYFSVCSPEKDYGYVYDMQNKTFYCDMTWEKN